MAVKKRFNSPRYFLESLFPSHSTERELLIMSLQSAKFSLQKFVRRILPVPGNARHARQVLLHERVTCGTKSRRETVLVLVIIARVAEGWPIEFRERLLPFSVVPTFI